MLLTEYPKALLDQSHCVPHPQSRTWGKLGKLQRGQFSPQYQISIKNPRLSLEVEHAGSSRQDVPARPPLAQQNSAHLKAKLLLKPESKLKQV